MQIIEPLMYIGSNRRSDKTVIEWPLQLSLAELEAFRLATSDGLQAIRARLENLGADFPPLFVEGKHEPGTGEVCPVIDAAQWVSEIALAMQQAAGHRVFFRAVLPGPSADRCRLIFEYEHLGTGLEAGELAMRILSESIPGLEWEPDNQPAGISLKDAYGAFLSQAMKYVLPLDTQAIIDAAARMDVPCVKLERDPYDVLEGDFRVRRNGLLKLGHSCFQHIVDGTLCIDRTPELVPLRSDREKLFEYMLGLGLPSPGQDREFRNIITAKRAVRSAERIGYPVVLKSVKRSRENSSPVKSACKPLGSAIEVRRAFEQMSRNGQHVVVEQYIAGSTFNVLLANHKPVCVVDAAGLPMQLSVLHASILDMAVQTSEALNPGLLNITLVSQDPGQALADAGGAVIDLDPAPQLDQLLADEPELMAMAAEHFVHWLYPPGAASRIPLVAVTGTNGKTTTSRMITCIMRMAGFSPGMASTSGVYLNETLHKQGDQAGSGGHHILFESREIDMGVLETARGAVANSGFMYDWSDVAVCLNVTYDHIGEYDIDTVEEMVTLKRSVMERARQAVVLNADYSTTRSMLPFPDEISVYLASVESEERVIREFAGEPSFACVLEEEEGKEWITLYEPGGSRSPVIPVAAIPATLNGAARFNISNAQHAICACHALGVEFEVIRQGLATFEASFENTPGRLNIYQELPFTVIFDFAHNLDGMAKLCAFTDQMDVQGRRILLCNIGGNRTDQEIAQITRLARDHFDHFACRSYLKLHGREPGEVPALIRSALLEAGVTEDCITLVRNPEDGARQALGIARPGDLVVLSPQADEITTMWQEIVSFEPKYAS
jgi:UDP-N-acetylmuramyl tripeptide synthase